MKLKFLFLALVGFNFSFAQIPTGYYNTAFGTGYTLKTQLYNVIKGHRDQGYAGLYVTYETSDIDKFYENDGTVLDMYSENPLNSDPYTYQITNSEQRCGTYSNEGDCYNREHIIPQSVFSENFPMKSDAHSVTPTDGKVNNLRSNYPHGTVAIVTTTSLNGSKVGSSGIAEYSGLIFEPIDEFKGDIARMYFYFATRYENTVAEYSFPMFNGTTNQVFTTTFLNMLMTWHEQDPVNAREIVRNDAIYARQNNRNPYIDHPEWVQKVWGSGLGKETFDNLLDNVSVYPNPSQINKITIETESEIDQIQITDVNGQLLQKIDRPKSNQKVYILENLKQGVYLLKLDSCHKSRTKKIIIN
jgi:endonuclease I